MADIIYTTKKYRITQKTGDNTANLMHPETEAVITLVDRGPGKYPGYATNVQEALKELYNNAESAIVFNTKEYWHNHNIRTDENTIYVYTDAFTYNDGSKDIVVAGIKIGDGNAYIEDIAFITDYLANELAQHIQDSVKHITAEERIKWNHKIDCEDVISEETLVLTRN